MKKKPKAKKSPGVGMPAALYLQEFGQLVWEAFGEIPYHVGSSMIANEKSKWRDVDVRLILDDGEYKRLGFGEPEDQHSNPKWRAMVQVFAAYGRAMTGLPIDFQIQQRSWANEHENYYRSALFNPKKL